MNWEKIKAIVKRFRNWAFNNWASYTFLKGTFFLLFFPVIYLATFIRTELIWLSLLIFLPIPVFFLLDSKRISVANSYPSKFILAERIEQVFAILFYGSYSLWFVLTVVIGNSGRLAITNGTLAFIQYVWLLAILMGTGLLLGLEINVFESSTLLKQIKTKRVPKRWWHLFEIYPPETIRAKARFAVLSEFLSKNHSEKSITRKFWLFRQGVKIYNTHLKDDFGFVLCEPKRFSNQARLATHSKEKIEDIRFGLEVLTDEMKDEKEEPLEVVKLLKEMLNEPASFKDVCSEIDSEPKRIRKWLSKNSESLLGLGGLIVGLIAIVPIILQNI